MNIIFKSYSYILGDIMESMDFDFYMEAAREELLDDDEITPEEEAFMKGYDEDYNY